MALPVEDFIRRFLLHVLPESFVRIRYFGLLSNRQRKLNLKRCRGLLGVPPEPEAAPEAGEGWRAQLLRLTGCDARVCAVCGRGHLRWVEDLPAVGWHGCGRSPS
jgi:hypothetical protein